MDQADAVLRRSAEAFELTEHQYARAKELIAQRAISHDEFDAAEHRQRISQADQNSATFAVKVAQYELEIAKAALARFDPNSTSHSSREPIQLVSPIDGQVLRVFQENASVVTPGTELVELGNPSDLEIKIEVLSTDAVRIKPGNKVYIEHWGGPHPLEAVVRTVEPSAFLKVSALGVEEKRVNVIADFIDSASQRETLGDGFRIEARIIAASTSEDALKVDSGSLFRDADAWFVYRVVDGIAERCNVEPGQTNGFETEIKRGLSVGEFVILHPTSKVRHGIRVKTNE